MTGKEREQLRALISEARRRQEKDRDRARSVAQLHAHNTGRKPFWTAESVIAELRHHFHVHGELPTQKDWERREGRLDARRRPSAGTVKKYFGSWNAAVSAAGLEPRQYRRAAA